MCVCMCVCTCVCVCECECVRMCVCESNRGKQERGRVCERELFVGRTVYAHITGLFCRISSILWGSFAKETYNLIDPTNQSHPIFLSHAKLMGWLRVVGSLKLQVSFAEYRLFYRALLQKRPII